VAIGVGVENQSSVSCPSITFCAAVGSSDAATYNGSSWSAPSDIDGNYILSSVSCPNVNFCFAIDEAGRALTYDGSSWSAPIALTEITFLRAVSCPTASFCVAVGDGGAAVMFTSPTSSVLAPSTGATLSGSTYLDASASNATSVEFRLFGGSYGYNAPVLCTATPTLYGWLCAWNTTTVPNGSFILLSEASNSAGGTFSSGVGITVKNPPTTSVLIPSKGATLSGTSATLDASASNATSVEFLLFGGVYGYSAPVICTASPTYYGWACNWNTTTVPNGSYTLVSYASGQGGSTASSGVSITLHN
jgi:ribosome biogenesis protein Tsr3